MRIIHLSVYLYIIGLTLTLSTPKNSTWKEIIYLKLERGLRTGNAVIILFWLIRLQVQIALPFSQKAAKRIMEEARRY